MVDLEKADKHLSYALRRMRQQPRRILAILLALLFGAGLYAMADGFFGKVAESLAERVLNGDRRDDDGQLAAGRTHTSQVSAYVLPTRSLRPMDVIGPYRGATEDEKQRVLDGFQGRPLRVRLHDCGGMSGCGPGYFTGLTLTGRSADGVLIYAQFDEKDRKLVQSVLRDPHDAITVEGTIDGVGEQDDDTTGNYGDEILYLESSGLPEFGPTE